MKKNLDILLFISIGFSVARIGNEPPDVDIDIRQGNSMFFFPNKSIDYTVRVVDSEDGSLADGRISPDRVTVRIDYMSISFDSASALLQPRTPTETPLSATAQRLIAENDCRACHSVNKPGVGPTYERIAQKYKGEPGVIEPLSRKVIAGGKGVWGEVTMSPHPQLSLENASAIVTYILSLSEEHPTEISLPVSGAYTPVISEATNGNGYFRLWASYTDRGTQSAAPVRSEKVRFFRSPVLLPQQARWTKQPESVSSRNDSYTVIGPNSYLGYSQLDLTDINQLEVKFDSLAKKTVSQGTFEVRLDSMMGTLLGKTIINKTRPIFSTDSHRPQHERTRVDLVPTAGVHDVYVIIQNPLASPQQDWLQISAFVLKSTAQPSPNR